MTFTDQQLRDALRDRAQDVRDVVVRMPAASRIPATDDARRRMRVPRAVLAAVAAFVLVVGTLVGVGVLTGSWSGDDRAEPASPSGPCMRAAAQHQVQVGAEGSRQRFIVLQDDCTPGEVVSGPDVSVYQPAVGADGRLAYVERAGERSFRLLARVPGTPGVVELDRSELSLGGPAWSPDGRSVAYWKSPPTGRTEVWVHRLDTGRSARVSPEGVSHVLAEWSPDSTRLVMTRADGVGRLVVIDVESGAETVFDASGGHRPEGWSPDGSRLLVHRAVRANQSVRQEVADMAIIDAASGDVLSEFRVGGYVHDAGWWGDGVRIATAGGEPSTSVVRTYTDTFEPTGDPVEIEGIVEFG